MKNLRGSCRVGNPDVLVDQRTWSKNHVNKFTTGRINLSRRGGKGIFASPAAVNSG